MVEKTNERKQDKGFVSETDMAFLLQRYSAKTVLTLLQEVWQCAEEKFDWDTLVKKTSTGISDAREYQMLWRYLAYHHPLLDKLEDGAQPLDDDSDLEYELEAFPDVSSEAASEAAACVKVLIGSGLQSDSSLPNGATVEAPLTINIPNGKSCKTSSENPQAACLMQGTNITVPVSVQKLPLTTSTTAEGSDANASLSGNIPPRKRRKTWTNEEDTELIEAVQKYGEGNWANILKGDFKWDRTASQLSQQRWSILRKKGYLVPGASSSSQLSEAQLAARHAMSLALDMPVKSIAASSTNNTGAAGGNSNPTTGKIVPGTASTEPLPGGCSSVQEQPQPQQGPTGAKQPPLLPPGPTAKSRIPTKKLPAKPNFSPDSSLRAAAVAAGARIMTPSDAASLLKVTQGKSAIHIMPSGVSSVKPSVSYIQTGLSPAPLSSSLAVTSGSLHPPGSLKPSLARGQPNNNNNSNINNSSSEQTNAVMSSKPEVKAKEEMKVSGLCSVSGSESRKDVQIDNEGALSKSEVEVKKEAVFDNPNPSSLDEIVEGNQDGNDAKKMTDVKPDGSENHSAASKGNCETQNNDEKKVDVGEGRSEYTEGVSKVEVNHEMQSCL